MYVNVLSFTLFSESAPVRSRFSSPSLQTCPEEISLFYNFASPLGPEQLESC